MLQSCRSIGIYRNGSGNNLVSCQRIINIIRNSSTTPSTPPPSASTPSISTVAKSSSTSSTSSSLPIKPLRFFDNPSGKHKTPKKR